MAKNVEIVRVFASEEDGFQLPIEEILEAMTSASFYIFAHQTIRLESCLNGRN